MSAHRGTAAVVTSSRGVPGCDIRRGEMDRQKLQDFNSLASCKRSQEIGRIQAKKMRESKLSLGLRLDY
ncbi:Uncharacterized protein TCM_025404 [Theobroma cacao]|uniref:Uncharacterized protein n=1 Tax=Theobroma cacao TaxID=3641 RepID=A0A061EZ06_THECC|nr:Uncharacterized protein TCM_025404 [Theobroma cacao]